MEIIILSGYFSLEITVILGSDAMQSGRKVQTFFKNLLSPFSG
jgi:hypothetical protein